MSHHPAAPDLPPLTHLPTPPGNRELLYLDLALENLARAVAERGVGAAGAKAAAFMQPLLQNLALSVGNNEELCYCLAAWQALPEAVRGGQYPGKEDALLAVAVVGRIRRALAEVSDSVVHRWGAGAGWGMVGWLAPGGDVIVTVRCDLACCCCSTGMCR